MLRTVVLAVGALATAMGCSGKVHGPARQAGAGDVYRIMDTTSVSEQGAVLERFRIYSPAMKRMIKAVVVLPPAYAGRSNDVFPVLYTLHGRTAPYDTWAQMPKLRAQLKDKPFIYTCFDGDNHSSYIDAYYPLVTARKSENDTTRRASLFATFFNDEFLPSVDMWYRVDTARRGVTGFSGGGQGAFNYMLSHPDRFTAVSALSAAFADYSNGPGVRPEWIEDKLGPFSEFPERYKAMDHFVRITAAADNKVALPPMYIHCGTEDHLIGRNRAMGKHLEACGYDIVYKESPGAHDWKFWHPASVGVAEFHWKHFKKVVGVGSAGY